MVARIKTKDIVMRVQIQSGMSHIPVPFKAMDILHTTSLYAMAKIGIPEIGDQTPALVGISSSNSFLGTLGDGFWSGHFCRLWVV